MDDQQSVDLSKDTIAVGGKQVLRFHPLNKRIKDNIPRCVYCGQIDEDGYHEAKWCVATGGDLPFTTSAITIKLKSDSGFRSEGSQRITLRQWRLINTVLNADPNETARIADLLISSAEQGL